MGELIKGFLIFCAVMAVIGAIWYIVDPDSYRYYMEKAQQEREEEEAQQQARIEEERARIKAEQETLFCKDKKLHSYIDNYNKGFKKPYMEPVEKITKEKIIDHTSGFSDGYVEISMEKADLRFSIKYMEESTVFFEDGFIDQTISSDKYNSDKEFVDAIREYSMFSFRITEEAVDYMNEAFVKGKDSVTINDYTHMYFKRDTTRNYREISTIYPQ